MGMDISGINPTINVSATKFPMIEKWEDVDWGKRSKDPQWKKEQDQYWKEDKEWNEANPGIYFRNNCWWWRPLWDFCAFHCPDIINKETHKSGHYNDGAGLNDKDAINLGIKLLTLIADGTAGKHEKEITLSNEAAKDKDPKGLSGSYPFSVENVKEFADFCIQSGGFKIW